MIEQLENINYYESARYDAPMISRPPNSKELIAKLNELITLTNDLEERVKKLEQRPVYAPYFPPNYLTPHSGTTEPPFHYHGTIKCYQNPCVWS